MMRGEKLQETFNLQKSRGIAQEEVNNDNNLGTSLTVTVLMTYINLLSITIQNKHL